jgi:pyruvate/2-oxoglutarate dehydrogenase complex dihydrolipoamide dehydrogenase (E3) component
MSGTYETEEERRRRENEEQIAKEGEPAEPQPLTDDKVYPQNVPTEPRVTHVGKTEEEENTETQPVEPEAKDDDLP